LNIDEFLDVRRGIEHLNKREKEVISLYFFTRLNEREISKILSVSQQRVSTLKKRALYKLRKFLDS